MIAGPAAPVPPATVVRLEARLREARERAVRGPLPAPQLALVERAIADTIALVPVLRRAVAALVENRRPALEEQRELLARALALDTELTMLVVTELRRTGRIQGAVRTYLALIRRAPRDDGFADRLVSFSHLLEEYAVNPAAGMLRSLARTLYPAWWKVDFAVTAVEETVRDLPIAWDRLPAG